jgi:hypothetical protein
MTPASAGRLAGIAWRHSAPVFSLAWALARALFALFLLTGDAIWQRRQSIFQGILHALVHAYVAAEATYHAGRRVRARLGAHGALSGTSAAQAPQALRLALLRFLARRYGWRMA